MLAAMTKVLVIGHLRRLDATLRVLQRAAVLHIVDGHDVETGASGHGLSTAERERIQALRDIAAQLDTLLSFAPGDAGGRPLEEASADDADIERIRVELAERLPLALAIVRKQEETRAEKETLSHHLASLLRLLPLKPDLVELSGFDTVALLIDRRHASALDLLREEMHELFGERFELLSGAVDADTVGALLIVPRAHNEAVDTLLARGQIARVRLPTEVEGLSFREALDAIRERIAQIPERERALAGELAELTRDLSAFRQARRAVGLRLARCSVLENVGATKHTFVIAGWVPTSKVAGLADKLAAELGEEVVLVPRAPREGEEAPVLLENPEIVRPFESLVRLFALPRAGALDPTPLLAIFLPLFFGLMLGDIGYGLLLLALARLARPRLAKKSPLVRDLLHVVALGAFWSVGWGVVFGELFGGLGHHFLGLGPLWMSREEAGVIGPLMMLCLSLGAVHVTLGLVLGVWNAKRLRDRGKMIERVGLLLGLVSLFSLAAVIAERLPAGLLTPSIAMLVVALAVMIGHQRWMGLVSGPLEVLSVVSNVLSYLRIAAIGLASVYLARVANELGARAPLWLGILIGVLFHALNLALGVFSPTIQALRLHYVELFGKFHEGGGAEFHPFGAERGASLRTEAGS